MPISFNTERDPNGGLLEAGVYKFYVEAAEEKMGPKGPYAALRIRPIVRGQKWNSSVFDNLSSSPDAKFRVDAFMDCVDAPNQPGTAGINWFPGKSGWARFVIKTGDDGVDRANVAAYLTETQAEKQLAKLAERMGSDENTMEIPTQRSTRPAPEPEEPPVRSRRKAATAVAELDPGDEDVPF